jgi:hypothetical protein
VNCSLALVASRKNDKVGIDMIRDLTLRLKNPRGITNALAHSDARWAPVRKLSAMSEESEYVV